METGYLQNGCGLIAAERVRQEQQLGHSASGDDNYYDEELRDAAIAYAQVCDSAYSDMVPDCWPWAAEDFHPSDDQVRNLVKAGALIAAEIDRKRRAWKTECNSITMEEFGFECFDDMDAYDLENLPWIGVSPRAFIGEHFEEDFARKQWEEDQTRRSLEEEEEVADA